MTEPARDPGFELWGPGAKARESQQMVMLSEDHYLRLLEAEAQCQTLQAELLKAKANVQLREMQMCAISEGALETIENLLNSSGTRTPEWDKRIADIRETIKSIME